MWPVSPQDISRDMEGELKVLKIDTDSYPKLASKYRVQVRKTFILQLQPGCPEKTERKAEGGVGILGLRDHYV